MVANLYADFGNDAIKWVATDDGSEHIERHRMTELEDGTNEYGSPDIIGWRDGSVLRHFMMGNLASRKNTGNAVQGVMRYRREYLAPFFGWTYLKALFLDGKQWSDVHKTVDVYGMMPPDDMENFKPAYKEALIGQHQFLWRGNTYNIMVRDVHVMPEPLCGFNAAYLTPEGRVNKRSRLGKKHVVGIDIGGFTVNVYLVRDNYIVDMGTVRGGGAAPVVHRAETLLLSEFRNELLDAQMPNPTEEMVISAISNGKFNIGRNTFRISDDLQAQFVDLGRDTMESVKIGVTRMGGIAQAEIMATAGGGSALLNSLLLSQYGSMIDIMPVIKLSQLNMANLRGLKSTARLLRSTGYVS